MAIPNINDMEGRIHSLEKAFDEMMEMQKENAKIIQRLERLIGLAQQANEFHMKYHESDLDPKVRKLWDLRTEGKGIKWILGMIGAFILGGATVFGIIHEVLKSSVITR